MAEGSDLDVFKMELADLRSRITRLEASTALDAIGAAAIRAGREAEPLDEIAQLKADLLASRGRLIELETESEKHIGALSQAIESLEQSVSWRVTAPLRAAGRLVPAPAQRAAFGVVRGAYWALTPHRMMSRFRWMIETPILERSVRRIASLSEETRARLGPPQRRPYGATQAEQVDIYRTTAERAPIFIFIHGGAWREGDAKNYAFPAEMFVSAGSHYVAIDFMNKMQAGGNLLRMVEQVRHAVAWTYQNAESFGGDRDRVFIGGHSSGAHLAALALVTDWPGDFALPPDVVKGGLLMSGMYDMTQIRRSMDYALFVGNEETDKHLSPRLWLEHLSAPVTITFGTEDGPEFQTHALELSKAIRDAGKIVEQIEAANYGHMEMLEALGNPYGPNGRAALKMMSLI